MLSSPCGVDARGLVYIKILRTAIKTRGLKFLGPTETKKFAILLKSKIILLGRIDICTNLHYV